MRANSNTASKRGRMVFRAGEAALACAGLLCLGYCAFAGIQASAARYSAATLPVAARGNASAIVPKGGSVVGTIEIPDLKLSAPVISGIDPDALRRGVGHVPGTAVPGGLGTMGLAGHRDTFFRALRGVKPGMAIRVGSAGDTYQYAVDSTEIVQPEDVGVLDIGSRPGLVLITCYPFNYIGAAPKRFIVHAHLLSVLSTNAG